MTIIRTRFFWRTGSAYSVRIPLVGWLGIELAIPAVYLSTARRTHWLRVGLN